MLCSWFNILTQAYSWVTNPSEASNGLILYLDGVGRSTQIGDFSAFFIGVSIFKLNYKSKDYIRLLSVLTI